MRCSLKGRPELLSNGHSCCMCLKMYAGAKVTWMGPWEGTAKAPLTGGEHRCQGQDKSWGHGVDPNITGGLRIWGQRAAGVRMVHYDMSYGWLVASPSDGL